MSQGKGPPWHGRSERKDNEKASLQAAIEDAWKNAEADGAQPGTYVVTQIEIETRNPIHAYSVTINPRP
jgi:hypothetical protein